MRGKRRAESRDWFDLPLGEIMIPRCHRRTLSANSSLMSNTRRLGASGLGDSRTVWGAVQFSAARCRTRRSLCVSSRRRKRFEIFVENRVYMIATCISSAESIFMPTLST